MKRLRYLFPVPIILIIAAFATYQIIEYEALGKIELSSVVSESFIAALGLTGLLIVQNVRRAKQTYAALFSGFSALLISIVTDVLDEFLVQPSIITVIFEDLFQIIGFLLVIIGLWLWTNYNEHLTSELSRLATTDDLTGAYNRRQFEVTTRREINRASRYTESLSLIMFDIDYFKRINDSDGHDAGDEVLKSIAEIVQQNIRDTDLFARVGGEEFTVLAPGTTIEGATEIAEKLRQKIFAHIFEPSGAVTASFGVVELKRDESLDGMSKRVDNALYQAKERGRNRVEANV